MKEKYNVHLFCRSLTALLYPWPRNTFYNMPNDNICDINMTAMYETLISIIHLLSIYLKDINMFIRKKLTFWMFVIYIVDLQYYWSNRMVKQGSWSSTSSPIGLIRVSQNMLQLSLTFFKKVNLKLHQVVLR